ncbi:WLM domain [Phytophthora cactorum]|nr:WLM domain [Phytophthora cactorum]
MPTLSVNYKGQSHALSFPDRSSPTIAELQAQIERVVGVQPDAQRLFQKRRRVDCSDVSRLLLDIEDMKATQSAVQQEMKIRESRRVVDISKRNQGIQARDTVSTSYRFHAIEPLKNFADKDKAQEILEKLANDRGILAMERWGLAEMPPDGKVGVDPVCVLGLNQNKGQKILLRLRTDDLLGFRKFLSIKKVLFHELSHNVHSEHDNKFYQLMRQSAVLPRFYTKMTQLIQALQVDIDWLEVPPVAQTPPTEAEKDPTTEDIEMEETEAAKPKLIRRSNLTCLKQPLHERTADEEVAALAMSDREKRIHDAVRHLQAHYSSEAISKAVSLLHKIISNIITHPSDISKCLEFLLALGFEDQSDKFVLVREDPALLWIGRSTLEVLLPVLRPLSSPSSKSVANVWERLLQTFSVPAPVANRFLPKLKAGPLLLEVGQPPEWKPFEVVLAGASPADLGLYYYPHKDATTPMGCIRLQSAHIDSLEEVLMVVTKDKTWFLCADHVRDASDWSDAICSAIERVSTDGVQEQRRRLDSCVSAVTLCELQSRDAKARVDEFLEVFVRSTREDLCLQAAKGALSWSCMRSLTWKVWLEYIPSDVPLASGQVSLVTSDNAMKKSTSTDNLLYSIYKDVRRTRGEMPFFRDPFVQCLMIRVLDGELLATLVYLLHIEQWPMEDDDIEEVTAGEYDVESDGRLSGSYFFPGTKVQDISTEEDPSYVYVESFINIQNDDSFSTATRSGSTTSAVVTLPVKSLRELTASEFIEHDAYLLLEDMMLRMAGTIVPTSRFLMNRIHHHILSRCDPPTARHLANLGVEPQIFLLRWVWQIWDAIFSLTPSDFSFINLLCVAVVREFRDEILAAEDATNVLLSLRDISNRIEPARLVDNARELYDALLIALQSKPHGISLSAVNRS